MSILVVGATGNVGRQVVAMLAERGADVRAATRTPGSARALPAGAEAVHLDLERPSTFASALGGVERAFLMARTGDEHADHVAIPLVDAMKRAGVRHVVNMTGMGVEKRKELPLRKLELYLEGSGMAFTHLRPNYFMQNFCSGPLLADLRERDTIAVPVGNAAISFVDVRDIAGVAVAALLSERHLNLAYTLTGSEAVSHEDIAGAISEVTGRSVRYVPPSDEEARQALAASGLSPERIERRLGFLSLARTGALSLVSPDVGAVLGRAPIKLQAFVRDHAATWQRAAHDSGGTLR